MARFVEKLFVVIGFYLLRSSLLYLQRKDKELASEIEAFPEGFVVALSLSEPNNNTGMTVVKRGPYFEKISGQNTEANLQIVFKGVKSAYRIFTTLSTVHNSFAQNRILVYGDLAKAMVLIRALNIVQSYLYPPILSKRALKRPKVLSSSESKYRFGLYFYGLFIN